MATGLSNIEHIVVVMFENRSFDNVLGWLYDPGNPNPPFNQVPAGQTFEGLTGVTLTNPWNGTDYPPAHGTDMTMPNPDPHEEYQFIYRQMFNPTGFDPASDTVPDPPPAPANMTGFVLDYSTVEGATAPVIMDCFRPADVPVISQLAASFAVCDHWYASVPSQTYTNRSFVHAGTASGYVNNSWKDPFGMLINKTPTIQNVLEENGVSFAIYYDSPTMFLCNALLCQERNLGYGLDPFKKRVLPMTSFYDALKNNTLPQYSFIEPNFINNPWTGAENDEHPDDGVVAVGAASNVLFGEQFLADIYNALTASDCWKSTLLVIIFDEHGGTFDHYPPTPSTAVPPDDAFIQPGQGGYSGFRFDRYGVRVPAVLVSPWITAGQVYNAPLDHTSAIRTILETFHVTATLGAREAVATDLSAVLNAPSMRTDVPTVTPRPTPAFDASASSGKPLTEFQQTSLMLAAQRAAAHNPALAAAAATQRRGDGFGSQVGQRLTAVHRAQATPSGLPGTSIFPSNFPFARSRISTASLCGALTAALRPSGEMVSTFEPESMSIHCSALRVATSKMPTFFVIPKVMTARLPSGVKRTRDGDAAPLSKVHSTSCVAVSKTVTLFVLHDRSSRISTASRSQRKR